MLQSGSYLALLGVKSCEGHIFPSWRRFWAMSYLNGCRQGRGSKRQWRETKREMTGNPSKQQQTQCLSLTFKDPGLCGPCLHLSFWHTKDSTICPLISPVHSSAAFWWWGRYGDKRTHSSFAFCSFHLGWLCVHLSSRYRCQMIYTELM